MEDDKEKESVEETTVTSRDCVTEVLRLMKEVSCEMLSMQDTYTIENCNEWYGKVDEAANICLVFGITDTNIIETLEQILCMLKYYTKAKDLGYETDKVGD